MHLLDVNVLIALLDASHVHHTRAELWWQSHAANGWASCPLTQNGLVRILGNPRYPGGSGSVNLAASLLQKLCWHPAHHFWPDGITILDQSRFPSWNGVGDRSLTDLYLLALAVSQGAKFATFDQCIPASKVIGGPAALTVIP